MTLWLPELNAYEPLLNRAEAVRNVETHLKNHLKVLEELVDYGTHLIPRCWSSSPRGVRDMVTLPILLKQIVGMLDAGAELVSRGCVDPAMLQLRAIFEASVYLDWILQSKSRTRARAYYVWNVRRQLRWINRGIVGSPEYKAYRKDLQNLVIESSLDAPEKQKELRLDAKRLSDHLHSPENIAWNKRFDVRRGGKPYDADWYQVLFAKRRSLRFLAGRVKRAPEYRIVYELGSETMHGSKSDSHVRILEGRKLGLRSLRELTEFPFVVQMLMGNAIHAYAAVLDEYRPAERENFSKKYVEAWRSVFMTRLTVSYEYMEATIG